MNEEHFVVLTGAGVSAESGLRTFRDPGGLWEDHDPRDLATPEAFARDPALVHRFYNWRRRAARNAEPNAAHIALAQLESEVVRRGGQVTLVTQNVDNLHQRAGSQAIAMHGTHAHVRCVGCRTTMSWDDDLSIETPCPICEATRTLRPNVVWFGEVPLDLERIAAAMETATLFVAVGTSGAVYPAAGLVAMARQGRVPTCELNLEPADNARLFDMAFYGQATKIVPIFVEKLLTHGVNGLNAP